MIDKSRQLFNLLVEQNVPVGGACPDVRKTGIPRVDYTPDATEADRTLGNKSANAFDKATIAVAGLTVTATVDEIDTHVVFSAFGSDGELERRKIVSTIAGVASYALNLTPDLYLIRAYGTITFKSGFMEVEVK